MSRTRRDPSLRTRWTITPAFVQPQLLRDQESWTLDANVPHHTAQLWRLAARSPRPLHQAVERCARCFQREFGYDFVQYSADEAYRTTETQAWLWTTTSLAYDDPYLVLGAACLRWRTYTNLPDGLWALQWIWLHPYARHHGVFRAAWPLLLARYDGVHLEPPVSSTLQRLVAGTPTRTLQTTEGTPLRLYLPPPPAAVGEDDQRFTSDWFAKVHYLSQLSAEGGPSR